MRVPNVGVRRRAWREPAVRGRRRAGALVGLAVFAAGGAVACEPGGLNSGVVAFTTDITVTAELEKQNAGVRWLSCTASYGNGSSTPSASADAVASVDCEGETDDGQDVSVTGKVTRVVNGACVRGNLTAKVGGKVWFHVDGLGNCDATSAPPASDDHSREPGGDPGGGGAQPTVTVTVTRTFWCRDAADCLPVEGK